MVAISPDEVAAFGLVAAIAVALVVVATRGKAATRVGLLASLFLAAGVGLPPLRASHRVAASAPPEQPGKSTTIGYVSSAACLGCHPGEHASFTRTYHRTMTQAATPETVRAPLDGRQLLVDGRVMRLERRGGQVWATIPDPEAAIKGQPAVDVTRRVVLTTGSHREQAFWVAGARAGDLRLAPFVWLPNDEAFVARREAFLLPPGKAMPAVRWSSNCIACHAVAGEPRHDLVSDTFDSRVADLGVTCEACHGPGAAHVERHHDPVARYAQHASNRPDPTIVHPGKIAPSLSAAVCGQCHAYAFPRDEAGWWTDGYSRTFRAGEPLERSRLLLTPAGMAGQPGAPVIDAAASAIFWSDGAVRVGGREYNGLLASPCYERGEGERKMTCLSCHAMHRGDPAGQIAPDRAGDRGCTSCHAGARSQNHSHHAAGSSGSACVSCHMPKTSYALLSAVRAHRIESPNVASTLATGKPNACNLCHLDRSIAWTARWLSSWYGAPAPVIASERARTAAGVYDGLAGDAGVRALIADALGSQDARVVSAPGFQAALLTEMLHDPYAAVRFIASRSLRAVSTWSTDAPPAAASRPRTADELPGLALAADGGLDPARVAALLAARDERAITIAE